MKLFHHGITCVSIKGKTYSPIDGIFEVPNEIGQVLLETFGFQPHQGVPAIQGLSEPQGQSRQSGQGQQICLAYPYASRMPFFMDSYLYSSKPKPPSGLETANIQASARNTHAKVGVQYPVAHLGYLSPMRCGLLGMSLGAGGPSP
jgi:hypothetical protein